MMGTMQTNLGLCLEELRRVAPESLSLAELSERTGVARSSISASLSLAISEGQPITRPERGYYMMKPAVKSVIVNVPNVERRPWAMKVIAENAIAENADGENEIVNTLVTDEVDKVLPRGRIGKILRLTRDLQSELMFFEREYSQLKEKARFYDKLSTEFRGFSSPDTAE